MKPLGPYWKISVSLVGILGFGIWFISPRSSGYATVGNAVLFGAMFVLMIVEGVTWLGKRQ